MRNFGFLRVSQGCIVGPRERGDMLTKALFHRYNNASRNRMKSSNVAFVLRS